MRTLLRTVLLLDKAMKAAGSQPTRFHDRPNYTQLLREEGLLSVPCNYAVGRKAGTLATETPIPDAWRVCGPRWGAW